MLACLRERYSPQVKSIYCSVHRYPWLSSRSRSSRRPPRVSWPSRTPSFACHHRYHAVQPCASSGRRSRSTASLCPARPTSRASSVAGRREPGSARSPLSETSQAPSPSCRLGCSLRRSGPSSRVRGRQRGGFAATTALPTFRRRRASLRTARSRRRARAPRRPRCCRVSVHPRLCRRTASRACVRRRWPWAWHAGLRLECSD